MAARTDPASRAAVRAHFERELSFDSLGAKLADMYQDMLARKRAHYGLDGLVPDETALGTG